MVPVVYRPEYQRYYFGPDHPFNPVRYEMLLDLLRSYGMTLDLIVPEPAERSDILTAHSETYVTFVEQASSGPRESEITGFGLGTMDVPVFEGMDLAARTLVGGTLEAARQITNRNASSVFQLGGGLHHAQRELASGFCVYNDLSVAIRHFTGTGRRVAYIDVDVHHGDGVQWLHYDDPNVLTISLHESGQYLFPGSGSIAELGNGLGTGYKLNVPLEPGTSDESYLEAFERVVPHALSWFQPHVLVVVCGADAHFCDPLADLLLSTRGFETLFRRLNTLAEEYTGGRALYTLAGGYDIDSTVRVWSILFHVINGLEVPETTPEAWRERWFTRTGVHLSSDVHDTAPDVPENRRHAIDQQNRFSSKRLMDMAARHWFW